MSNWVPGPVRDYVPGQSSKYERTPSQDLDSFEMQQGPAGSNYSYGAGGYEKSTAYRADRFRSKKRLNDPIFLLLFIVVVSAYLTRVWTCHSRVVSACGRVIL